MKKILVIDDAAIHLKSYETFVSKSDIADKVQLLSARNGEEGLSIYINEDVDLIFSDIEMPTLSGYDVCLAIRESAKYKAHPVPIIMVSSHNEMADQIKGRIYGADDYITKPFKGDMLVDMIKKYVNA